MRPDDYNLKLLPPSFSPWQPTKQTDRRIAVLMSGGVDSSVTAHLLKEDGWDVLGLTMKIPIPYDTEGCRCCGADAAFACDKIGIPHYFIDVTNAFQQLIIQRFRRAYANGRTPNPCIDCNTLLKFSLVWNFARAEFGITHFATGHYARIVTRPGQTYLRRAADKAKDQSYFLYGLPLQKLNKFVLPLGELTKQQVRSITSGLNLDIADKPESMELCFAGQGDYRAALADSQADRKGDITDMHGNIIGTHKGIANYTLGQRRGLGFAGGKPLYVGRIDPKTNTVALGTTDQVSFTTITADETNILIPNQFITGIELFGKIRSYGQPKACKIVDIGENNMTVEFNRPQFAPCPGQRLVLYDKQGNVVAGGTISAPSAPADA